MTPELAWFRAFASWAQGRIVDLEGERDELRAVVEAAKKLDTMLPEHNGVGWYRMRRELTVFRDALAALTPTKENK
jgi:hypothetical protein